ncbi:MAG: hypothetical protein WC314_17595 [Vulcanimicrobiota bacterium]
MNIMQTTSRSAVQATAPRAQAEKPPEEKAPEYEIKQDMYDVADRYNDSRRFANGTTGLLLGAVTGAVDGLIRSPQVAYEFAENMIQAETIGPNLKVLGTLAALPVGALSAVASPFVQAFRDARMVSNVYNEQTGPLKQDAMAGYIDKKFSSENPSFSKGIVQDLEVFGAKKLGEGEKPYDVPILSPLFSIAGGVVSGAISGVVGLTAGLAAGMLTTSKEAVGAIFGKDQTIGKRVGRLLTSPLHTVAIPYGLVKEGLKESVPRGFVDGWKHGPVKPVVDTAKASVTLAAGVLKEAWER